MAIRFTGTQCVLTEPLTMFTSNSNLMCLLEICTSHFVKFAILHFPKIDLRLFSCLFYLEINYRSIYSVLYTFLFLFQIQYIKEKEK